MTRVRAEIAGDLARRHFTPEEPGGDHFNCAESTLLAVCESAGIKSEAVPAVASPFGGGMGRQGGACGAVTGAIMAIGLDRGRKGRADPREPSYEPAAELHRRFKAEFGATTCRELIGCDLNTPEGQEAFKVVQASGSCGNFVAMAARTAVELLDKDR